MTAAAPSPLASASAGLAMLAASMGIARFAYTPLLPEMRDAFGWTLTQAGDVASANYLGYVLGALIAAPLARHAGRKRWLQWMLLASVLTTAAGALVDGYPAWLALRFASGLASAFTMVLGAAIVLAHLAASDRGDLYGVHFAGVGTGMVVSVLVLEAAGELDAASAWGALGVAAVVLALPAARVVARIPNAATVGDAATPGASLDPLALALARLVLAYGLFGFGYVVTATFLIAMLRDLAPGPRVEPLAWILVGLMAAPSVPMWQRLGARFGVYRALRVAFVLEAAGVALAGVADGVWAVVLGGIILGATFMGITAMGLNVARRDAGPARELMLGWMTASFGIGQLLGPAVAARLSVASGDFMLASLLAAALLLVGALLMLGLHDPPSLRAGEQEG